MKVFRIVKAFVGLVSDETAPSPPTSELADAIGATRPAKPSTPSDGLTAHRKATNELAAELSKSHSRIGPAPKARKR